MTGIRIKYWHYPVLLTAILAILLLTIPKELSTDSLNYAFAVKTGHGYYHSHHVLYSPSVKIVWNLLKPVYPDITTITAAQIHNIFFALAFAFLLMAFSMRIGLDKTWSLIAVVLLFCTSEVWRMTVSGEVYVPALFFAMTAFYLLYTARSQPGFLRLMLISLMLMLGVLFHQLVVLSVPAILVFAWTQWRWRGIWRVSVAVMIAGALTIAVYMYAAVASGYPYSIKGLIQFALWYAIIDVPGWGDASNLGAAGSLKLFRGLAGGFFPFKNASQAVPQIIAWIFTLSIIVVGFFNIRSRHLKDHQRGLLLSLLIWLLIFIFFTWWWLPQESEFHVFSVGIIFLLSIILRNKYFIVGRFRVRAGHIFLMFALIVVVYNLWFRVSIAGKPWKLKEIVMQVNANIPPGVLFIDDYMEAEIMRYYTDHQTITVYHAWPSVFEDRNDYLVNYRDNRKALRLKYMEKDYVAFGGYAPDEVQWRRLWFWMLDAKLVNEEYQAYSWNITEILGKKYLIVDTPVVSWENEEVFLQRLKIDMSEHVPRMDEL